MIDRGAQTAMVVILEGNEAERLQHTGSRLPHRGQELSHAVNRPCLRLKREFDKGAGSKRMLQLQQAAGHGNTLEFGFCTPAIF